MSAAPRGAGRGARSGLLPELLAGQGRAGQRGSGAASPRAPQTRSPPRKGFAARQRLFEVAATSLPARRSSAGLEAAPTAGVYAWSSWVFEALPALAELGARKLV